jgi:hypothetical protein
MKQERTERTERRKEESSKKGRAEQGKDAGRRRPDGMELVDGFCT